MDVCRNGHAIRGPQDRLPRDNSCRQCHRDRVARYNARQKQEILFARWVEQQLADQQDADDFVAGR